MCVSALPPYICIYMNMYVCVWCLWRVEEGVGTPGTGVSMAVGAENRSWVLLERSKCS